jgi:hypothetical protein
LARPDACRKVLGHVGSQTRYWRSNAAFGNAGDADISFPNFLQGRVNQLLSDENSVGDKSIEARLQSLNQAGVFRLTEKCHGAHSPQVEPVGKFARTKVVEKQDRGRLALGQSDGFSASPCPTRISSGAATSGSASRTSIQV